ncbi:hypothetical protein LTR37_002532 [Vermiconidia calcicola]|uniref:Uncharacterized protein n=1 Tax=Vermiconidia calcicola TaxID=1690605 RepID=A0ACC3NSZ0_9PEZI|nr:hypothetical protein LTR37_002532 [Vermiconidia calcicola]
MPAIQSILYQHRPKNIALVVLSILFLPLDSLIFILALLSDFLVPSSSHGRREAANFDPSFTPKTVLVTGVGMSKGLALARSFYEAGHNVIGADFDRNASGRVSKAISLFYTLKKPSAKSGSTAYIEGLLEVVLTNKVDLWVSCSGVASAVEDGEAKEIVEARTSCKAIQFDVSTTQTLHEKDSFIARTKQLGLNVPDTHTIMTAVAAEKALREAPANRKYIMKPVGMDDASRGDLSLLPKATEQDTARHLSGLRISEKSPWILQQFIEGREYCTHSVVIKGRVRAFVACPSAELLMHYEPLAPDSKLSQAMLKFTQRYASAGGEGFTGHLSFDFMVEQKQVDALSKGQQHEEPVMYPIECNPRAHTADVLFNGMSGLTNAYLSVLDDLPPSKTVDSSKVDDGSMVLPERNNRYYWVGHDLVELIIIPMLSLLFFQPDASIAKVSQGMMTFVDHLLHWQDGTFERWDPAPWWWLYHVYWPMQFVNALKTGKRWSRINVSTTKVFEC